MSDQTAKTLPVVKSLNEELMQALYVVMVPDEVDLHGDITSEEEVRKACHNFNKFCRQPNLCHLEKTTSFEIAESYCTPVEFVLGDRVVKKGTWVQLIQTLDKDLWELQKSGQFNGLSIGAMAEVQTLGE